MSRQGVVPATLIQNGVLLLLALCSLPHSLVEAQCSPALHEHPFFQQDPACQLGPSCDQQFCFGVAISLDGAPLGGCCDSYESCGDTKSYVQTLDTLQGLSIADIVISGMMVLVVLCKIFEMGKKTRHGREEAAAPATARQLQIFNIPLVVLAIIDACLAVGMIVLVQTSGAKEFGDELVTAQCFEPSKATPTISRVTDALDRYYSVAIAEVVMDVIAAIVHVLEASNMFESNNHPYIHQLLVPIFGTGVNVLEFGLAIANLVIIRNLIGDVTTLYESMGSAPSAGASGACLLASCLSCLVSGQTCQPQGTAPSSLAPNHPGPAPSSPPTSRPNDPTEPTEPTEPTYLPQGSPSAIPTANPTLSPSSVSTVVSLIQVKSPKTLFEDPVSPQSQALAWMLTDEYTLGLTTDDRLLQRFALATLWYSTGAHHPGWLEPTDECTWDAQELGIDIRCDAPKHAVSINLGLDNLFGTIPVELALLTSLTFLNLSGNSQLRGTVPTELANMTALKQLLLYSTDLTGTIANSFCELPDLERLAIDCDDMVCECCETAIGKVCRSLRL